MKLVNKTLLLFSCLGFSLASEAKQIESLFNHSIKENVHLNLIDSKMADCPACEGRKKKKDNQANLAYQIKAVKISNQSSNVVKSFLPLAEDQNYHTIESLVKLVDRSHYPVKTLYKLWTDSVKISEEAKNDEDKDVLAILNYHGSCSKQNYVKCFAKLCLLAGIDARPATIQGGEHFDFCFPGNEWEFVDPLSKQIYLDLNNHTLASSEQVLDDPFLALRTKHNRSASDVNFNESWKKLAQFQITDSYLNEPVLSNRLGSTKFLPAGFTFYPEEIVIYYRNSEQIEIAETECLVENRIVPSYRIQNNTFLYESPFPIRKIANNTDAIVELVTLSQILLPGESFDLVNEDLFNVDFVSLENPKGSINIFSVCSEALFPNEGVNLEVKEDHSQMSCTFECEEEVNLLNPIIILNQNKVFDYCTPYFDLANNDEEKIDKIWWQISSEEDFSLIPSNFENMTDFTNSVILPTITDTFFNSDEKYYFRVRALVDGIWKNWSEPFVFSVTKPDSVTFIEFDKIENKKYEISWREVPGDSVEYLIFASNSLDFVPSIYSPTQINEMDNDKVVEQESNDNLKAITKENKIIVNGRFAFYRIIARDKGQYSTPSRLIHVYDQNLFQRRNVLQVVETNESHVIAKRVALRSCDTSEHSSEDLLITEPQNWENKIFDMHAIDLDGVNPLVKAGAFVKSKYVVNEVWNYVQPHLMPENHPLRAKLDRLFSSTRVIQNPESFKKAGFPSYRVRRASHIMASPHPKMQGYFIKAFPDSELNIREDWRKLVHRVQGANLIRDYLAQKNYQNHIKVPKKWIYPLPEEPSPPKNNKFLRKNFILVAEDMRIWTQEKNNKMYKSKMTKPLLEMIYNTISDLGLYDSVYAFNIPFSKDGKIAIIDTEYNGRWPIPYNKLNRYLSSDMQKHWNALVQKGRMEKGR